MTLVLGVCGIGFLVAAIAINEAAGRIICGSLALFIGAGVAITLRRFHNSELILNAGGLQYTAWIRPLEFQEVEKISVQRVYSSLILTFHLKAKMPPICKFSVFRFPVKKVKLSVSWLEGKPLATAQTIFDYFARQIKNDTEFELDQTGADWSYASINELSVI